MQTKTRVIDKASFVNCDTATVINKALKVGLDNHGFYTVLPPLGELEKPIVMNHWRFVPRDQDDTYIPKEADRQVMALKKNGILIRQEIVGHDLVEEKKKQERIEQTRNRIQKGAEVLRGLAMIGGFLAVGFIRLAVSIIALAITADPILIVVLEDGTWLCVAEWEE